MFETLEIGTPDGRTLETRVAGPPDGEVLLFHHGTPAVGIPAESLLVACEARNLRYVAFARPGYAGSTRRAGRTVASVAEDVAVVLDHLGVERCLTMGQSGGGPHALACAALIPGRISAATITASVAPFDADGLDFLDGMGPENVEEFGATVEGPAALQAYLAREAPSFGQVTGADIADALGGLASDVDRAVLTGDYADSIAANARAALSTGYWGWFDDDIAFVAPWGFDPGAIGVPVEVWQGGQDMMVPFAHGVWLAGHVRGARPHLLPEHGHLSLAVASIGTILDEMLAAAGGRASR